jgi:hypothetical protein
MYEKYKKIIYLDKKWKKFGAKLVFVDQLLVDAKLLKKESKFIEMEQLWT